jgi:anthranilate synthase component 1
MPTVGSQAGGDARGFLAALDRWWSAERQRERIETPFAGGWFLYLGYELAAEVEPTLALTTGTRPKASRAHAWCCRVRSADG